jgi:hypothetical protein
MDLLFAVPTACNSSSSIDVNVKNRWSQSRNIKDLGESFRMCLYTSQTRLLQKVFCVGGGKNIPSHKALQFCKGFAMNLQKVICNSVLVRRGPYASAAGWNGCYCGRDSSAPFQHA